MNTQLIAPTLKPIFQDYNIKKAILFGSYAKNTATEKSDIDLYIESDLKGLKFVGFIEKIHKALGEKPVDVLNSTHVENNSKVLNEIKNTGVLIYERR